jgi:hypothetical protein
MSSELTFKNVEDDLGLLRVNVLREPQSNSVQLHVLRGVIQSVVPLWQEHEGVNANPVLPPEAEKHRLRHDEDVILANTNLAVCSAIRPPPYLFFVRFPICPRIENPLMKLICPRIENPLMKLQPKLKSN